MKNTLRLVALALLLVPALIAGQQQPPPPPQQPPAQAPEDAQPRFRGGANLVRVDAYITKDGTPVADLTAQDFEVLEDNVPQRVESFEFIKPRPAGPQSERREPNTVAEAREMAADPDARLFVLFLDVWHVQLGGSYRAQAPLTRLLSRVIGQDDLVGVMTPEMSARNLTLARRTTTIEGILKDNWFWGQRDQLNSPDPREEEIKNCYPESDYPGIASAMILRRREGKTLDAIQDLVIHLETLREERKFVLLLSEGWRLPGPDQSLARQLKSRSGERLEPPGRVPVGVDPQGRLRMDPDKGGGGSFESCERERSMLAYADHATEFQNLLQRANRANVSFYPIDARGLVVFDEPIGPAPPPPPSVDAARLRDRHESLRSLAADTDGYAILDTNAIDKALERVLRTPPGIPARLLFDEHQAGWAVPAPDRSRQAAGAGRRARPGYLAPTDAELASARVDGLMRGKAPGYSTAPPNVGRALERLAPARGNLPVRVQAAAGAQQIWITTELDAATLKLAEWQRGARGSCSSTIAAPPRRWSTTSRSRRGSALSPSRRRPARRSLPGAT